MIEVARVVFVRDWRGGEQSEPQLSLALPSGGVENPADPSKICPGGIHPHFLPSAGWMSSREDEFLWLFISCKAGHSADFLFSTN